MNLCMTTTYHRLVELAALELTTSKKRGLFKRPTTHSRPKTDTDTYKPPFCVGGENCERRKNTGNFGRDKKPINF